MIFITYHPHFSYVIKFFVLSFKFANHHTCTRVCDVRLDCNMRIGALGQLSAPHLGQNTPPLLCDSLIFVILSYTHFPMTCYTHNEVLHFSVKASVHGVTTTNEWQTHKKNRLIIFRPHLIGGWKNLYKSKWFDKKVEKIWEKPIKNREEGKKWQKIKFK